MTDHQMTATEAQANYARGIKQMAERLDRLLGAHPWGFIVVDQNQVRVSQLRDLRPGRIILADSTDAVRFIPAGEAPAIGCIAGWISEDDS